MSTFAMTHGATARYNTPEQAAAAYSAFVLFCQRANLGELPGGGDYTLSEQGLQLVEDTIHFEAESSREQNLQWQLEQVLTFLRGFPGLVEFDANVVVAGDGVYWTPESES